MANARQCIFVADENKVRQTLLSDLFSEFAPEYSTLFASTGKEFFQIVSRLDPCVIILSGTLPDYGPLEILSEAVKIKPDVPILFCIDSTQQEKAVSALTAGAKDILIRVNNYESLLVYRVKQAISNRTTKNKANDNADTIKLIEEKLEVFFNQTFDAIFILDPGSKDLTIVEANNSACEIHGWSREELIGKPIYFLHAVQQSDTESQIDKKLNSGEALIFETEHIRKNGTTFPVEVHAKKITMGGKEYILGIDRDISERKKIEKALIDSIYQHQLLLDNIPLGISVMDNNFNIRMVNNALTMMLKKEVSQLVEKRCFNEYEKRSIICPHCPGVKAMKSGTPCEVETQGLLDDGAVIYVRNRAFPIRNADGNSNGFIEVIEDVSKQKLIEQALRESKEKAEAANIAKSEFLANMSHEIRTPMNGIIGITNLVLETELTDEQKDYLETVKDSADSLLLIINDILDISKIEAGKFNFYSIIFNIRELIEKIKNQFIVMAQKKGLKLSTLIDTDIPQQLTGDPLRIRQILTNLIGNAIKFTDKGEVSLMVSLSELTDKNIRIDFIVKDTGIGISPSVQNSIFDKFYQADSSTKRKYGGTGLGLAISKRIVGMMGGNIDFKSNEGGGSLFKVSLVFPFNEVSKTMESSNSSPLSSTVKDLIWYLWIFKCRKWTVLKQPKKYGKKNKIHLHIFRLSR